MKKIKIFLISAGIILLPLIASAQGGLEAMTALLNTIKNWLVTAVIAIGAIFIVLAGLKFLTAQGDEGKVRDARMMLLWSLVGIAVAFGVNYLVSVVQGLMPH